MALWKSPWATGEARRLHTDSPPADSPEIVIWLTSPPKRAPLAWTQRSAVIWSSRPFIPPVAPCIEGTVVASCVAKKPRPPKR